MQPERLNNEYLNLINRIVRTFSWTLLPSVFASVRNLCDKYLSMLLLARIENELSFGRRIRRCRVPDTARYATDYNRNWMPPNEFIYFIYIISNWQYALTPPHYRVYSFTQKLQVKTWELLHSNHTECVSTNNWIHLSGLYADARTVHRVVNVV